MSIAYQFKTWLLGHSSTFKVDDSVQLSDGYHLMIVTRISSNRKMKQPFVECLWYETTTKWTKKELFAETTLKPFEWSKA